MISSVKVHNCFRLIQSQLSLACQRQLSLNREASTIFKHLSSLSHQQQQNLILNLSPTITFSSNRAIAMTISNQRNGGQIHFLLEQLLQRGPGLLQIETAITNRDNLYKSVYCNMSMENCDPFFIVSSFLIIVCFNLIVFVAFLFIELNLSNSCEY